MQEKKRMQLYEHHYQLKFKTSILKKRLANGIRPIISHKNNILFVLSVTIIELIYIS